jgi:isopentenyl-diphosphate delta-isomerase
MSELILVDEQDNQIGTGEKISVHKSGALHRAFSIFVFRKHNNKQQILLQKRYINKYHSGGLWANSCCGHPNVNESIIAAGQRRITEELGIKVQLRTIGSFIYKQQLDNSLFEHEFDHVLIGLYQNDPIVLNPEEVDEISWQNVDQFDIWLEEYRDQVAVWLPPAWKLLKSKLHMIQNII